MNSTSTLQRNILLLEYATPKLFREKVYNMCNIYSSLPIMELDSLMELCAKEAMAIPGCEPSKIEQLCEENKLVEVSLLAKLNALSMLMLANTMDFKRPIEWWRDVSMQLVDVSTPSSRTIH